MVGGEEAGSGAGAIYYCCIDHARARARWPTAPAWLAEEVAAFDAQEAK